MKSKEEGLNKHISANGKLDLNESMRFIDDGERTMDEGFEQESPDPTELHSTKSQELIDDDNDDNDTLILSSQSSAVTSRQRSPSPESFSELTATIKELKNAVSKLTREVRATRKRQYEVSSNEPDFFYKVGDKNYNLSTIPGKRPSKYGIKVAETLFNGEELREGMLSPQKQSNSRPPLSPNRASALKVVRKGGDGRRQLAIQERIDYLVGTVEQHHYYTFATTQ